MSIDPSTLPFAEDREGQEKCENCGKWVEEGRLWTVLSPGPFGGKRVCFECRPG